MLESFWNNKIEDINKMLIYSWAIFEKSNLRYYKINIKIPKLNCLINKTQMIFLYINVLVFKIDFLNILHEFIYC